MAITERLWNAHNFPLVTAHIDDRSAVHTWTASTASASTVQTSTTATIHAVVIIPADTITQRSLFTFFAEGSCNGDGAADVVQTIRIGGTAGSPTDGTSVLTNVLVNPTNDAIWGMDMRAAQRTATGFFGWVTGFLNDPGGALTPFYATANGTIDPTIDQPFKFVQQWTVAGGVALNIDVAYLSITRPVADFATP